jgi:hypothetical protein
LGLLILVVVVFRTENEYFPGKRALWPVLGASLVILAGFRQTQAGWLNRCLLSWRPMVAVGLVSYPLYLWHWPLLSYARIILGEMPGRGLRIGLFAVAFALAILTYLCVERPIRFGQKAKGAKAVALIVLMAILGGAGATVYRQDGMKNRRAIEKNLAQAEALQGIGFASDWSSRREECQKKFNLSEEEISEIEGTCLYHDAGGKNTMLLLGDSHASASFDRIAEFNARSGINTWMLQTGNPFVPLDQQKSHADALLKLIAPRGNTISKVFIIERGVVRVEGRDVADGEGPCFPLGEEGFYQRMQYIVDRLREMGKEVFIVSENPVLHANIRDMMRIQPLRPYRPERFEYRSEVLKHQVFRSVRFYSNSQLAFIPGRAYSPVSDRITST